MSIAFALATGAGFVGAAPVAAASTDESYASARFLSGTVGDTNLDDLVALEGVEAQYDGGESPVVEADTLNLSVLRTVDVPIGPTTVPLADLVRLGAVNQYAEASPEARSRAAAGAVSDTGAVNTAGSGTFPADATVSLTPLLGELPVPGVIDEAAVRLRAISAVAALDGAEENALASTCADLSDPDQCRDYTIAGGELTLSAPVLAQLVAALTGAIGVTSQVDAAVAALETELTQVVDTALSSGLDPALAPLVTADNVSVSIDTDLTGAVNGVIDTPLSGGGVTIDLRTGTITADLEQLLGRSLDNLPPNTEIFSDALLQALAEQVSALLATLPAQVQTAVGTALTSAQVSITGGACAAGATGEDCVLSAPLTGNDIGTGFSVDVTGTLGDLGSATTDIMLKVLGNELPVETPVAILNSALGDAVDALLGGALTETITDEFAAVLAQVIGTLSPALDALNGLVSLLANVQEDGRVSGAYREVALRVTLGAAAGGTGIAQVDLARVEVGPNLLGVDEVPVVQPTDAGPVSPSGGETLPAVGAPTSMVLVVAGLLMLVTGVRLVGRRRLPVAS